MRIARYFDPDAVRTQLYVVRQYEPDDMSSLMLHMGDLVANFDMLLVGIKGTSSPTHPQRYNPTVTREQLREARMYLDRLNARLRDAIDITDGALASDCDDQQQDVCYSQQNGL